MGVLVDRIHRELTEAETARISGIYHAWRGEAGGGDYADVPGFCASSRTAEIEENGFVLTPGRYVGALPEDNDDEPFEAKMARHVSELARLFDESRALEEEVRRGLGQFGPSL
jgi:type I restriction enzyme M protein